MTSTLTLNANTVPAAQTRTQPITAAQIVRTLACKWDLFAVIGLLTSCTAYGVFALGSVA